MPARLGVRIVAGHLSKRLGVRQGSAGGEVGRRDIDAAIGLLDAEQIDLRRVGYAGRKVVADADGGDVAGTLLRRIGAIGTRFDLALGDRRLTDEPHSARSERRLTVGKKRTGAGQRHRAVDREVQGRCVGRRDRHVLFDPHTENIARAIDDGDDRVGRARGGGGAIKRPVTSLGVID